MKQLPRYLSILAALLLVLLAFARGARADNIEAQALFEDAKKLMDAGKYEEACPKLEESQRLDPGMGTQFHLAYCYEKQGKTASAWALYLEVASAAKAIGQMDREKVSRTAAAALEKKLSRLTIQVPNPVDGMTVKRDNTDVSRVLWGTPVPVDPGEHTIIVAAPNKKTWEDKVSFGESAENKTVDVPALEDAPAATGATTPVKTNQGPAYRRRSKGMMAGGIIMLSIGAPVFVINGVLYLGCGNDCKTYGGGAIIGAVLTAGGIALTVTGAEKIPINPKKAWMIPKIGLGPGSATAQWTF